MNIIKLLSITFIGLILLMASCTKENSDIDNDVSVSIVFIHNVGNENVEFENVKYINAANNTFGVSTLKYFISNVSFQALDGSTILFDEEHYIDGRDITTLTYKPEKELPSGEYKSISFIFGLDTIKNVAGRFPNPPESNMEWPLAMGPGYHYMKLEGKFDSTGVTKNYQAHTGQSMGNPFYFEVTFDGLNIKAEGSNFVVEIIMDINEWWNGPNVLDLNDMTSVMGNLQIQQQLKENGMNVFKLGQLKKIE